ncbi:MAG: FtsQ-type POTRA domain-containing protein [Akkermansia sp.]|nr:FtsQ-type POTRA domain-containing protein [Akkermansia sp.]
MKSQNRYRSEQKSNVHLLEKALSFKDRIFSMIALRRGMRRLRRYLLILICALPVLYGIWRGVDYAIEKAYSLSIENISYKSRRGLISKEQALKILEIDGAVNMATFDAKGMQQKLENIPGIDSARIRAELPDTLHIEVDERIPIVFVEMESGASTGRRTRLFMDPKGILFPVNAEYHKNFMGVPTWYLQLSDIRELKEGERIPEDRCRPIRELIAASNAYDLTEIPAIREIFRPKEWKIQLTLDNGTSVTMQVYEIKEQMERLAMMMEHTQVTGVKPRSINVIQRINPTYIPAEEPKKEKEEANKSEDKKKRSRR